MISQAVIINENKILMVKQYVQRGDIVWNFPGGNIEEYETPFETCIREVKEETGYDVAIKELLYTNKKKYIFLGEIIGGELYIDKNNEANNDIIDAAWIPLDEDDKFDNYTAPVLEKVIEKFFRGKES
ncbi:NUDIX domain-containing protein [Peribacillus acanthi]|uniref:NUDIX domain-containing protein n=1 Tax=Peribacillus acanthi TaxID=2171554 RepID=UPI000D3E1B3A|nr:NUDIX hydrolase [Peribacillus acanthi]